MQIAITAWLGFMALITVVAILGSLKDHLPEFWENWIVTPFTDWQRDRRYHRAIKLAARRKAERAAKAAATRAMNAKEKAKRGKPKPTTKRRKAKKAVKKPTVSPPDWKAIRARNVRLVVDNTK